MTWKTPIPLELSAKRGKRSKRSADADWVTVKNVGDDGESYEYNAVSGETRLVRGDSCGEKDASYWEEVKPLDGGRGYWYNKSTGESTWENPHNKAHGKRRGGANWMDASGSSGVWEERKDDAGRTFFFNASTGASQTHR